MITSAAVLSVLALLLGAAAYHPRLRLAYPAGWACVVGVAACLIGNLLTT